MREYESHLSKAFIIVFSLVCVAFFSVPLLWLLTAPFTPKTTLAVEIPANPTLENFRRVFDNSFAIRALFRNNLIIAGGAMLMVSTVATLASYGLSRTRLPGKNTLVYVLMLFSSVVGGTAAMVPLFLLAHNLHLIDTHLGVILVLTGGLLPAAIFMMRDFVESIPRSYEEAAIVYGASPLRIFCDIAFPLIRPGVAVVAIWTFVNAWGAFLIPVVMLRNPKNMPASVALYSFYSEAGTPIHTLVAAYAFLYGIPVLVLYLLVNWRFGFRFFGGIKS